MARTNALSIIQGVATPAQLKELFGANIFTISAGRAKSSHLIGTHHQPIIIHQRTPRLLTFNEVSETI